MRTLLLVPHVVAGGVGLVLGPFAVWRVERTAAAAATAFGYHLAVVVLCATAIGLTFYEPGLWWLAVVAVATAVAARAGWVLARERPQGWRARHRRLLGGSYVAFVTGFFVVSTGWLGAWVLPTIVGVPIIEAAAHRQRRPRPAVTPSPDRASSMTPPSSAR